MSISIGLSGVQVALSGLPVAPPVPVDEPVEGLAPSANLLTVAQSTFATSDHIDFRGNWSVVGGRLTCLGQNTSDARISLDAPMVAGRAYFSLCDLSLTGGTVKMSIGGDSTAQGRAMNDGWQGFQYYPATSVNGNYTRVQPKPSASFSGSIDELALYDLSTTDPNSVPCDVIIIGGDSNSANATSDFVTKDNRETAFDPRLWYMPCLRSTSTFGLVGAERHVPFPIVEPVIAAPAAARMSPVHAAASRLVGWSAARNRPLLVMALGDPGSGLMNTEDWRRPDRQSGGPYDNVNTASRMWDEMVAMKAAVEALGPAHEVVGAIWSLGQNDGFSAPDGPENYDANHTPAYQQFFNDVRDLFGDADMPMVLTNIAQHVVDNAASNGTPGFGSYRQTWLSRFDMDSGHPNAISNFRVIQPAPGNAYNNPSNPNDPHYNAAGIQQNGRDMGDALLSLLS